MTQEKITQITDSFAAVRARMDAALARRRPGVGITDHVDLLAATKTVPPEEILFAVKNLGLTLIGENRESELTEKYPALEGQCTQHFIGHLQTNKIRRVVGKVAMIESVDSDHLAAEIERRSAALGITTDILVEVNSGREENKGGILPENVLAAAEQFQQYPHLRVRGLMTMAPLCAEKEAYRKYFRETYAIFIDFLSKNKHNIIEPVLSMGMSDSFEIAVEEGATQVRVGSALFGRRLYPPKNETAQESSQLK
jgi:pyridoxal phosphate enzyme (YggS family)